LFKFQSAVVNNTTKNPDQNGLLYAGVGSSDGFDITSWTALSGDILDNGFVFSETTEYSSDKLAVVGYTAEELGYDLGFPDDVIIFKTDMSGFKTVTNLDHAKFDYVNYYELELVDEVTGGYDYKISAAKTCYRYLGLYYQTDNGGNAIKPIDEE
jgi:hypothetical protein